MRRNLLRYTTPIMIALGFLFVHGSGAHASDIVEFIPIPEPPNVQASVDLVLACRNGVQFEFNAVNSVADLGETQRDWDISFASDEGELIIKEYPLWLAESATPLQLDTWNFPYRSSFTLAWPEPVPAGPLTTCVAGAGTGFCQFQIPIEDCMLVPDLNVEISQIAPGSSTPLVSSQLVFEVRAYDPLVGTDNGAGIDGVELQIIDYARGTEVYSATIGASDVVTEGVRFCAFFESCDPWDFTVNDGTWPSGAPLLNGAYLLRALVTASENQRVAVQQEIHIELAQELKVARVPAGEFEMGSTAGTSDEQPVHTVEINESWIMETEVTYGQYAECIRAGACTRPRGDLRWDDPLFASHPVVNVDWVQANQYATWAGGRLPTEAEWERACRGGAGNTYPWGDELPDNELANFNQNVGDTTPVGAYPAGANSWGLLDMSGNVWEWTNTIGDDYPYTLDDGREEAQSFESRIVRGGSYFYTFLQLTCSARTTVEPGAGNEQIGFRLVFDEAPVTSAAPAVHILEPVNGASVPTQFNVELAVDGLVVEPAGARKEGAGHLHLLIDADFAAAGGLLPFDDQHIHLGKGETSAVLELEPGTHTLRLQFADGTHVALEGDEYRDEIVVTVDASLPPANSADTPSDASAEQAQTEEAPADAPTPPADTPEPPAATATPAPANTPTPVAAVPELPGIVADFEAFGTWQRGIQPWGTFVQTSEEVQQGNAAGKLQYDFSEATPGSGNEDDYVIFLAIPSIGLGDVQGLALDVYGDGSGNFLNAWIIDSRGSIWAYTFGTLDHTGWQEMSAPFDASRGWPNGYISQGPEPTTMVYPIRLHALVLDGEPGQVKQGVLYLDNLQTTDNGAGPVPSG